MLSKVTETKTLIGLLPSNNNYKIFECTVSITSRERVTKYVDGLPYTAFEPVTKTTTYYSIEENGSWLRQFETKEELEAYIR